MRRRLEMKRFKRVPSPAMVVALIALFVAIGGSAYAGIKVDTNQIQNGAVTAPKLRNGAVTGSKLSGSAVGSKVEWTYTTDVEGYDSNVTVAPSGTETGVVSCPAGKEMIFASYRPFATQGSPPLAIVDMDRFPSDRSMRVMLYNGDDAPLQAGLWGLCI